MRRSAEHSLVDRLLTGFDEALRTCVPGASHGERESPGEAQPDVELGEADSRHVAGLMRINHTGEVCAQALYRGQAATARIGEVRETMEEAAAEEIDHLVWCEQRLAALGSRPSFSNPLWYGMSFGLGALAGIAGDRWSLGFVAETEKQVCEHLEDHLRKLPDNDRKSRAVLEQMLIEEEKHGATAKAAGGAELPKPIQSAMTAMGRHNEASQLPDLIFTALPAHPKTLGPVIPRDCDYCRARLRPRQQGRSTKRRDQQARSHDRG